MPRANKHEKNIYNRGYSAGARRIVLEWLGKICSECGSKDNIEIAHIKPVKRQWREYTDWLDKDNVKLLCTTCNQREENGSRNKT